MPHPENNGAAEREMLFPGINEHKKAEPVIRPRRFFRSHQR